MRRPLARTGLPVLLLLVATGCGASSRAYRGSASDEFRSAYGYGDMFGGATTESDSSGSYAGGPPAEPGASYQSGGDYEAEEAAPMATTAVSPEPVAMDAPMAASGTGGAGGYAFEDDVLEGEMSRPEVARVEREGGGAAPAAPPRPARPQLAEAGRPAPSPAPGAPSGSGEAGGEGAPEQVADAGSGGPLLIYEASLNLAVHQVREKMADVIAIADDLGGFLQRQDDTTVVVRVPAQRFREALERVEAVGDVLNRRVTAEDVTERFRDVRIRLRNALEMRDRMAELLQRADTVPDSLTIQRELERLTQEIELYRGQLRAMEDRIAFSTITVMFQPIRVDAEVPRESFRLPFPWLDRLGLPHLMELR